MPKDVDVAIIGGGVQGCGVAQAAAAAGYSTLIIEKSDWGSGTSSKSSKLIHGGLRYLQTGQFKLVRECLLERNWMLRHTPELVSPNWFYLPIYKNNQYPAWMILAGLCLYRVLNLNSPYSRFRWIKKNEWQHLNGLKTDNLKTVFAYQDGQTDDQQLTLAIKNSAEALGAQCLSETTLVAATRTSNGYQLKLQHANADATDAHTVNARVVINATGPWVNETLNRFTPVPPAVDVDFVQGTHIVIDRQVSDMCFYLEAPQDSRAIFVMPWKGTSLIGTTETVYQGSPDDIQPHQSEIDYLLDTYHHYFPDTPATVINSFCGLRVLPRMQNSAFKRPRDVMIKSHNGIVSLYGGKLTAWRATAADVMPHIYAILGNGKRIDTRKIELQLHKD
ncbi:Aerobic glycerol-3-phosphate dehydrogenase [BD1-7 clade bacterium]|uniref:Aerobic glycerol-3-phosphate dehydrogenase n=1 Tax=BD1-7 clade bacterium TaxID=2029982 RepID=A0A5S9MQV3_9GAMM|nr:Aerobic glycerol-3-phosphate dehydrogenase [BD1-7 clade bacterium]